MPRKITPEEEAARARFGSGPGFTRLDHGTPKEQARRPAIVATFDAADQGDYGPGIALGIFAAGAAEEVVLRPPTPPGSK